MSFSIAIGKTDNTPILLPISIKALLSLPTFNSLNNVLCDIISFEQRNTRNKKSICFRYFIINVFYHIIFCKLFAKERIIFRFYKDNMFF